MKRLMSFLFPLLLCLLLPLTVQGEALTGTCGADLTWAFSDGTLTISGTGAMYAYE